MIPTLMSNLLELCVSAVFPSEPLARFAPASKTGSTERFCIFDLGWRTCAY